MTKIIGTGVALATPMNKDYSVNRKALGDLIDFTIDGGVDYAVVMGTTGESPVFTWKEMLKILEFVTEKINDRIPIVFGVGGNDTEVVMNKSGDIKSFGLEAILSVCPYYNKPSQKGLLRHFQMIADASDFPVILYNVPARTVTNIDAETTIKLASHPNIIAIKEAGALEQAEIIIQNAPDDFHTISGDDANALVMTELGGSGVISVAANLIPRPFSKMIKMALKKEFHNASELNHTIHDFYELLSGEGNPVSLKAGLEALGICERTVKPPLYDASDQLVQDFKELIDIKKESL